jgi:hypothetical protein
MASAFASSPPFHCTMDSMATLTAFHPPAATIFPTMSSSGCSRTNPVPPRSKSNDSRCGGTADSFGAVMIKKEAGTPCQVDEVTTSRKERRNNVLNVQTIKAEPAEEHHKHDEVVVDITPSASAPPSGEYNSNSYVVFQFRKYTLNVNIYPNILF